MEFVDWFWQPYDKLALYPDVKNKQAGLVIGSGMCMPNDGLEFTFVPMLVFDELERKIKKLDENIETDIFYFNKKCSC